jgi:hypothetical protein
MRYVCLVHLDPAVMADARPAERQELDRRWLDCDEELRRQGHYLASAAIEGGDSGVLVRVRDGSMSATDGPYMQAKEQMAGFILLEARDMNEAVRLAARIPIAEIGTVEVRQVLESPPVPRA